MCEKRLVTLEVWLTDEQIEAAKQFAAAKKFATCCAWQDWLAAVAKVAIDRDFPPVPRETAGDGPPTTDHHSLSERRPITHV